ncbi:MAG: hypothetical protein V3V78_01735 [Candidatus Woesearchaeota archaeon]
MKTQTPLKNNNIFIRYPHLLKDANEIYIRNCIGAFEFFDKWYNSKKIEYKEYKSMLKNMRKIIALGKNDNGPYRKIDSRLYKKWFKNKPFDFRKDNVRVRSTRLKKQKLAEYFGSSKSDRFIKIHKIPKQGWPHSKKNGFHIYPRSVYLELYLKECHKHLIDLKKEIEDNSSHPIKKIASYYFYAINARPFSYINNSLFMIQVNYMLIKLGYDGTYHYDLDHLAHRMQLKKFQEIFKKIIFEDKEYIEKYKEFI